MSKETKELVTKMAQFSISTNQINEVQSKNLKIYPLVFFNGVTSMKIEFDLTTPNRVSYDTDPKNFEVKYKFEKPDTGHMFIRYELTVDEKEDNTPLDRRCDDLKRAVHNLFWKDITVEILLNGKSVFKGR